MKKAILFALPLFVSCTTTDEESVGFGEALGMTGALLLTPPLESDPAPGVEDRRFDQLAQMYFETLYALKPASATQAGLRAWDGRLGVFEKGQFSAVIDRLRQIDKDLGALNRNGLSPGRTIDREILASEVKARLLDLTEIRPQQRNPNYYLELVSDGAFTLAARNFGTPESRMHSLVSRLRAVPACLEAAKANLDNPPRIFTEIAIDQTDGAVQFFSTEVAQAFPGKIATELRAEFESANAAATSALKEYRRWLESDCLPASRGQFAIGRENYRKKLLYEEMVELPIETLIAKGEEEVRRLESRAREIAASVYPGAGLDSVFASIGKEHPTAENLIATTSAGLEKIRQFCVEKDLLRFPSEEKPIVRETPSFRRSLSFASMDMPGALETEATEAYYSVTLPAADWPAEKQEQLLRFFNPYALPVVSIHEAFPGHFTQFLWVKKAPSMIRKLLGCSSNSEGWAHYCEEMLLDEGYGDGDARLRLGQIQLALVRACRYLAGIKMHTMGMTVTEATNLFMDRAHLDRANAEREARRGAADPTYLVYTLGKLMILDLLKDYKVSRGNDFRLGDFHNAFLSCGYPPIPVVRKLLLP